MEMSTEIKEIAEALANAQAEIASAEKDRLNPHFNQAYATLASVWDACRAPLTKHGIAVFQDPFVEGQKVTITTMLLHKSGQWFKSILTLVATQATPQGVGSAITYARRYALSAMAGVAPADDDDGNAGSGKPAQQPANGKSAQAQRQEPAREASKDERARLKALRADLNKRLQACKTEEEHRATSREFAKLHGGAIWGVTTGHNDTETFAHLAAEHLKRVKGDDVQTSWAKRLEACAEEAEFRKLEQEFINTPALNTTANEDLINEKGKDLKLTEYLADTLEGAAK